MRITLPDRPGALGAVTTALGSAGADIASMEIVARTAGVAIDDFVVSLPDATMPDELVSACHALEGVEVIWIAHTTARSLVSDVELLDRILATPHTGLDILVAAVPQAFHSSWAMFCDSEGRLLAASTKAPEDAAAVRSAIPHSTTITTLELPSGWLPDWPETTLVVLPMGGGQLVVARHGGPGYLDSEVARLRHLVAVARLEESVRLQ